MFDFRLRRNSPMYQDATASQAGSMDEIITQRKELSQVLFHSIRCENTEVMFILKHRGVNYPEEKVEPMPLLAINNRLK
jgi:hypothetical protein